jgi:hypothetical protein
MFWAISSTVSSGSVNAAQNSFYLCAYDVMCIKATVSVASGAQYVSSSGLSMYGTVGSNATGISEGQVVSWWLNTASTTFTNNSTTAWTSLGTLINSYSVFTGITLIKRIA